MTPAPLLSLSDARASVARWVEPLGWFKRERFPELPSDEQAVLAFQERDLVFPEYDAPEVSIVIPVYGQFATTWACLASLANTPAGRSFEVIVADDSSPDQTERMLGHVHGLLRVRNSSNIGYLRTNNRAARHARGKWLCLLNNDTRVTAGWLAELVDTFSHFPDAGLVGAKLLFPDGRLQEAGGIVFRDGSCANYGRFHDPNRPDYSFARPVDYCSAACALIPKALWDELGGFDEHFAPAYYEDTDLAFRVRAASRSVIYQPLARVVHYHGMTHGRNAQRGLKRSLLGNKERFRERWRHLLDQHPRPTEPSRSAAERRTGPGVLVLAERAPELDPSGAWPRSWDFLEQARRAGCRVSLCLRQPSEPDSAATRALQRRGVEVVHAAHPAALARLLRASGSRFRTVLVEPGAADATRLATLERYAPRARVQGMPLQAA